MWLLVDIQLKIVGSGLPGIHDDGNHQFALLRGGSYFYAHDHWHVGGGAKKNNYHWKLQILNEGMNRPATLGFRCVYDAK